MKFGVQLPHMGRHASGSYLREFAATAEAAGFYSVWVGDHVVVPKHTASPYTLDDLGRIPPEGSLSEVMGENFDSLTTLSHVAAVTTKVRLGTSVAVAPLRHPLLNATMLASIDALSEGRLIYGVGIGWLREEVEALDMPWDQRGARVDEHIEILRKLWSATSPFVQHQGRFYSFDDIDPRPRPAQEGGPPILIGGHSDAALARVGRLGDGWIASRMPPEQLQDRFRVAKRVAQEHGRDPEALTIFTNADFSPSESLRGYAVVRQADDLQKNMADNQPTMPDLDAMVQTVRRYEAAGVSHLKLSARMSTREDELKWLEFTGKELLPQFKE